MNKVMLKLQLPVSILRENKKYVAYTPALDLSTSGKDYQQVKKRFTEIVNIFFEELIKKGTFSPHGYSSRYPITNIYHS